MVDPPRENQAAPPPAAAAPGPAPAAGKRPRILLVRPSALGDVARTVPALVTLRHAWPEAHIDWLVQPAFAAAVRHHPALDGVVSFPRDRLAEMWRPALAAEAWRWLGALRQRRYDQVFDLQGLFRSGLVTRLTGAPERVGYANARELAWLGYNRKHPVDRRLHSVERMLGLLAAAGLAVQLDMRLYVGPADTQWFETWRGERGLTGVPYSVLAPMARWPGKCWPIERYVEIARRLVQTRPAGEIVIVLAAPAERVGVQPLIDALVPGAGVVPADHPRRVFFPPTTVGQMMAILAGARLLVCNDSAPLHLAVGLGRPVVAVFGPTDPAEVGPYQRADAVVRPPGIEQVDLSHPRRYRADRSLIARVSVESVWEKMGEQVGR